MGAVDAGREGEDGAGLLHGDGGASGAAGVDDDWDADVDGPSDVDDDTEDDDWDDDDAEDDGDADGWGSGEDESEREADEEGDEDDDDGPKPHSRNYRTLSRKNRGLPPGKKKTVKQSSMSPKKLLEQERARTAFELRKGGATYDSIAKAIGYKSAGGARKAVERAMKGIIQEPGEDVKRIQIERCNHMLLTLWPQVNAGDSMAMNTALRVMNQLDLYMGTQQAQQVEHTHTHTDAILVVDGSKEDYIRNLKRMAGVDGNGNNIPQITQVPEPQPVEPQAEEVIIDAEVVEDTDSIAAEVRNEPDAKPVRTFDFGMDPKRFKKE